MDAVLQALEKDQFSGLDGQHTSALSRVLIRKWKVKYEVVTSNNRDLNSDISVSISLEPVKKLEKSISMYQHLLLYNHPEKIKYKKTKIELCIFVFSRVNTFGSWVLQHPHKCQNSFVKFGRKLLRIFFSIFIFFYPWLKKRFTAKHFLHLLQPSAQDRLGWECKK